MTPLPLNHVTLGTVINSYTYDPVGNRETATENGQTTTYTYDANDRMLTSTQNGVTTTYTYDDNGNTTNKVTNGDEAVFGYDAKNKLIEAVQYQANTPVSNVYFQYDIDGNRTQKIDNGTVTNFVVDRNQAYAQVIHETNDQNATLVTYTHGDDLISQDRNATINYYNYDGLGSTRSLTDFLGQITDTYDYNAYGTILDQSGSTANSYLYTGEQFDASLDNYYLRARYYDPAVGRFTQMDTYQGRMNEPVSLHKYLYANGDPVNGRDPSGHTNLNELEEANTINGILTNIFRKGTQFFVRIGKGFRANTKGFLGKPKWRIWIAGEPSRLSIYHQFIFAEKLGTKAGYRYDISPLEGKKSAFRNLKSGVVGLIDRNRTRKRGLFLLSKAADLTITQYALWDRTLLFAGASAFCTYKPLGFISSGDGANCIGFSLYAAGLAKTFSKMRLLVP